MNVLYFIYLNTSSSFPRRMNTISNPFYETWKLPRSSCRLWWRKFNNVFSYETHSSEIVTNWLSDAIKLNFLWCKRAANTCIISRLYKRGYEFMDWGRKKWKTISFEREIKKSFTMMTVITLCQRLSHASVASIITFQRRRAKQTSWR